MSAPTPTAGADKQANQAKAELQQRIIDALAGSKIKTDKLEALLKSSPQYANYIVKSAESHVQYFQGQGLSGRDARTAAQTSATREAAQAIQDVLSDPLPALRDRAKQSLQVLDFTTTEARRQIASAEGAISAIKSAKEFEFIKDITSKNILVITWDQSGVEDGVSELKKRIAAADKLRGELIAVETTQDVKKAREALQKYVELLQKTQKDIGEATKKVTTALNKTSAAIDEKALEALITQKIAKNDLKALDESKKWFERALSLTGALLEKTTWTGTLNRGLKLANTAYWEGAKAGVVASEAKDYKKSHTRAEVYGEHDEDPMMLPRNLVARQTRALEILLQSLETTLSAGLMAAPGVGDAVMQAWAPISVTVKHVVESRLKKRLSLAQAAVDAGNAKAALEHETDEKKELLGEIREGLLEELTEQIKEMAKASGEVMRGEDAAEKFSEAADYFKYVTEYPGDFTATVLGIILPPIMEGIWKIWPPKPAQSVTGADLERTQDALVGSIKLPIGVAIGGAPPPRAAPRSVGQRPADIPAGAWAQFVQTDLDRSRDVGNAGSSMYRVAVRAPSIGGAVVWGDYNPRSGKFTAVELDPALLEDWSGRTIAGAGFSDGPLAGGRPANPGRWAVVKVGTFTYVRFTGGGGVRWGNFMARTRGPRGTDSMLGSIIEKMSHDKAEFKETTIT